MPLCRRIAGANLRKDNRIALGEETADQLFAAWPPHASPAADNKKGRSTEHLMHHVVILLAHAEKHREVHSHAGRKRSMLVDQTGPLITRRTERRSACVVGDRPFIQTA